MQVTHNNTNTHMSRQQQSRALTPKLEAANLSLAETAVVAAV